MEDNEDIEENPLNNPLYRILDQKIRRTGFSESFLYACNFHLKKIDLHYYDDNKVYDAALSQFFLVKVHMYPENRFSCEIDEKSDWPVPVLPVEYFSPLPEKYRIASFYEYLTVGNILDCRVASIQPTKYTLRVIHKCGSIQILDDLNIMVKLFRTKSSNALIKKDLFTSELIRVAVSDISNKNEVCVTLKGSGLTKELGRISEESLPSYIIDLPQMERYSFYSCYLKSLPQFKNPTLLDEIFIGMGCKQKKVYSFFDDYNGLTCSNENTGKSLLNRSKLNDAKLYASLALEDFESGEHDKALESINKALDLYTLKDLQKANFYFIRGNIYRSQKKMKEAVYDYSISYTLDPSNSCVTKQLSKILYKIANGFYRHKEYGKAFESVNSALEIDRNNENASAVLKYLKEKHPEEYLQIPEMENGGDDEKSLAELVKKRGKIVSKLKRISR